MIPRILILHGLYGNTSDHWQTVLYQNLKNRGVAAAYPELPHKDTPVLGECLKVFADHLESFQPDVLVGHSLGVLLILHALDMNPDLWFRKIALVAPPAFNQSIPEAKSFFPVPECTLSDRAEESLLVCSDNDPWCPVDESKRIEALLGIRTQRLPSKGHINPEAGFGPWQEMMDWVLNRHISFEI